MAELFKPELESILPNWTKGAPKHVKAFFTCRTGGVSSGLYGGPNGIMGLNLALHTGDVKSCAVCARSRRAMDFDERGCGLRDDGRLSARLYC